jgi:hypothetical protein
MKLKKCYSGFEWDLDNDNGQTELVWVACLLFNRQFQDQTYWNFFCTFKSPQWMDTLGQLFVMRRSPLTKC